MMNIEHTNELISLLESLPKERISMKFFSNGNLRTKRSLSHPWSCGTSGCIAGWALTLRDGHYEPGKFSGIESIEAAKFLGINFSAAAALFHPDDYGSEKRYPAHRVIATLKRLRDTYLSTGQVVVDWGPEPGEEPKQAWTAPQVAEVIAPVLPAELTSLLRPTVEA